MCQLISLRGAFRARTRHGMPRFNDVGAANRASGRESAAAMAASGLEFGQLALTNSRGARSVWNAVTVYGT